MLQLLDAPHEIIVQVLLESSLIDRHNFSLVSRKCHSIIHYTPEIRYAHIAASGKTISTILKDIQSSSAWKWVRELDISCACAPSRDYSSYHTGGTTLDVFGSLESTKGNRTIRLDILGLSTLILEAVKATSIVLRRYHSTDTFCCYNIFRDNEIWNQAFQSRVFTVLVHIEVDLPSICFVHKTKWITFLESMPNVQYAKILHAFVAEREQYLAAGVYKLRELEFEGQGTHIATHILVDILSRCPVLERFVYFASSEQLLYDHEQLLQSILQLRVTRKLPNLQSVRIESTGKLDQVFSTKVYDLHR
jgi:hypothetical protein